MQAHTLRSIPSMMRDEIGYSLRKFHYFFYDWQQFQESVLFSKKKIQDITPIPAKEISSYLQRKRGVKLLISGPFNWYVCNQTDLISPCRLSMPKNIQRRAKSRFIQACKESSKKRLLSYKSKRVVCVSIKTHTTPSESKR